ncbi:MAG: diacylglycerol kinase [Halanaerobacter sp.]
MKILKKLTASFNHAIVGVAKAFILERNLRIHFLAAGLVIISSLLLDITKMELIILLLTISAVITAELFNTALEKICDLITEDYHHRIKLIKDISAGAVLVTAVNAIIVAYVIFARKLDLTLNLLFKLKSNGMHIAFFALAIVFVVVTIFKLYFKEGTPLQGGMPSGHTAAAFCLLAIIVAITDNVLVVGLSIVLVLLVAQSRVESGIHKFSEVFWGALLGLAIGTIVLQLLYL